MYVYFWACLMRKLPLSLYYLCAHFLSPFITCILDVYIRIHTCVYALLHMYISIYMYAYICACFVNTHSIHIHRCVHTYLYEYISTYMYMYTCAYLVHTHPIHIHIYVYTYVCVYISIYMYTYTCNYLVHICVHIYIHAHVHNHIHVFVCVRIYIHVNVHLCLSGAYTSYRLFSLFLHTHAGRIPGQICGQRNPKASSRLRRKGEGEVYIQVILHGSYTQIVVS